MLFKIVFSLEVTCDRHVLYINTFREPISLIHGLLESSLITRAFCDNSATLHIPLLY